MFNKNIKVYDTTTTIKELIKESLINFLYGFIANTITVFIITKNDIAIFMNLLAFYFFASIIINRKKYESKFGKYIVFPIAATLGAFLGYKTAYYLTNILQ